ncbi:MAG: amidohydrolase family protein [Bacteroidota bacterium]
MAITNVSLIDGTGKAVQESVTICIKEDIIQDILPKADVRADTLIDGSGKFVIPGLFDGHVHTTNYKEDFPRFIHYGVTSILITGGSLCTHDYYAKMRQLGKQDTFPAPVVFHTSQHFTIEGRHPAKTYVSNNWRDGESIFYLRDTTQIESLVQEVAQYPISGIKLTIEEGPAPPYVERIPQAFIDKTVKEAKAHDLKVFAHVSDNKELSMAIEGGVQTLLHFTGVNIDPANELQISLIEELASRDPSWVTTLMLDKGFLYPIHPEWLSEEAMLPVYKEIASELIPKRRWRASLQERILKQEYQLEESSLAAFMTPQVADIQFLQELGINMVLGTDTGNEFIFPGYSLHEEMQNLEMGGMQPLEIIKMASLNAAKMLEVEAQLGSIEVGKSANLVLLHKDPLASIKHTLDIHAVIKKGVIQKRMKE